jgi:hypothetical protein
MEFVNIPNYALNVTNPDYDMEFFWYGFKNLIKNYFHTIQDNDYIFSKKIDEFSENLNLLQKDKKYSEIYENVYNFIKRIINSIFKDLNFSNPRAIMYLVSWIKRYNKIKDSIKIELLDTYNKNKTLNDLSEDEVILIKLKLFECILEKNYNSNIISFFDENKELFIKECIDNKYIGIFDYISVRYNLDDFYTKMDLNLKSPVKLKKILNYNYKKNN